jgi:hypothetical protein
MMILSTRGG